MSQTANVLYEAPGPRARRLSLLFSVLTGGVIVGGLIFVAYGLGRPRVTAAGTKLPGLWDHSRWDIFAEPVVWRRMLWDGLVVGTLRAAGLAAVLALIGGVMLCFLRMAKSPLVRVPTAVVLEFFRGMPVLLMMLFIMLALRTGGYWAVVGALAVYNAAIIGEALRAGLASLPRGQREAGLAVGLTTLGTRIQIEFPQAFRQMLPVIVAQLVVLLKDTSLAYIVSYPEILRVGYSLRDYFGSRYLFSIFLVTLATYLIVNFALSALARWLAKRTEARA